MTQTLFDDWVKSAFFSTCGCYRYKLEREVAVNGIVIAYFGVNPSTAGAEKDDATSRKWIGFTKANGGRSYIAGNPFAFISTNPSVLHRVVDPVGPENPRHLREIIEQSDLLVPCWGNRAKLPKTLWHHLDDLASLLKESGKPVKIFGLTKSGDPMHPLMLGYDTQLIPWEGK